jgi:uncharacterized protein (DUF3820 family)
LTGKDLEERNTNTKKDKKLAESGDLLIPFGKHNGKKISELDIEYMRWCVDNFDKGNKWVKLFKKEIIRREVVE